MCIRDRVKAKISEQQARLKELEKNKQEAENLSLIHISAPERPLTGKLFCPPSRPSLIW